MDNDNTMHEHEIKHLEFIQSAITRMGANSFQMKGWAVTIFSAFLALFAASEEKQIAYLFVAVFPLLLFWFLDAYYLQLERKFRGIYDDVAKITPVDHRQVVRLFDMPLTNYRGGKYSYWNALKTRTISSLYLLMIVGALVGGVAVHCK